MIAREIPNINKVALYCTKDTARILEIDRHTLLRYVNRNLIIPTISKINGRKMYRGKEILRFWKYSQSGITRN